MNENTNHETTDRVLCEACSLVPLSELELTAAPPVAGWEQALAAREIEVLEDDLGRPSIARSDAATLVAERRAEAEQRAQQRAQREPRRVPSPPGVPSLDGAGPYEALVAAGGVVTPRQEFGGRRESAFTELLEEQFAEGQRQRAVSRDEARALKEAKRVLEGGGPR